MISIFMLSKHQNTINIVFVLGIYCSLHISYFVITSITQNLDFNSLFPFLASSWTYFPPILLLILLPIINLKKFNWNQFELAFVLKPFILILAGILFWEQAFSDYDFYLNTNNNVEKTILVISFVLLFFNPMFIVVFLTQSYLIWLSHQFVLGSFHFTDIRPAYEIITLFVSFLFVKRFGKIHSKVFLLLALSLHASNYFIPGMSKIEISPNGWEWIFLNQLSNLFVSSFVNGWLGFLDQNTIINISYLIDKVEFLFSPISVLIEISSIMLLIHKRASIFLILGFQLLHLSIFLASGIFFWSWMIVNFGLIFILRKLPEDTLDFLYLKKNKALFIFLVVLSPLIYQPSALGWWDSRLNTIYDFILTTENEKKIKFNRNDFGPYDMIFSQNRFYYASNEKVLNGTYGILQNNDKKFTRLLYTIFNNVLKPALGYVPKYRENNSFEIYQNLQNAKKIGEVKKLIQLYGKNLFDLERKLALESFLKNYFVHLNNTTKKHSWYHKLGAPYHIYDLSEKRFDGQEDIVRVEVIKSNVWFNKEENKIVKFGVNKIIDIYVKEN
ncbi:hypothetical protein OAQ15_03920 [Flavobacteriaceae bacterium]|nr:hypothetical protein [Flavobacteriaceae bacterium]